MLIIISFSPNLWIYWFYYKDYLVSKNKDRSFDFNDFLTFTMFSFPVVNWLILMTLLANKSDSDFNVYLKKLNSARKCDQCNITSRLWQLDVHDTNNIKCPHCNNHHIYVSDKCDDKKNYPFAPRISSFKAIKRKLDIKKLLNVKQNYKDLEMYEEELEAYEKLQMKKLLEFEKKAAEIKVELGMK